MERPSLRKIAVVTVARSDFGIYQPVLKQLRNHPDVVVKLIVAGMHWSRGFGETWREIEDAGFEVDERVEMTLDSDFPNGVAQSMALGMAAFGNVFSRMRPDILLVLGDRFEMFSAAAAAVPFPLVIAHLHGGELTLGAIDDSFRHAISKMAHLHFVATPRAGQRLIQMGEPPERICVSGAPGLDGICDAASLTAADLRSRFGIEVDPAPILVTVHPETRSLMSILEPFERLLQLLSESGQPLVFTYPNADPEGRLLIQSIESFLQRWPKASAVPHFGREGYLSMLKFASAMVGNSSSGILEAASFGLPVLNIGNRQSGRERSGNVIDATWETASMRFGITKVLSSEFRAKCRTLGNCYGRGQAATRIASVLRQVPLSADLREKPFFDLSEVIAYEPALNANLE